MMNSYLNLNEYYNIGEFMAIDEKKIHDIEFLGGIKTYAFIYKKNNKEYPGTITITTNVSGGMILGDEYEIVWDGETPGDYTEKDDSKIASAVYEAIKNGMV